ncbi:uncharacterized protein LOC116020255 [Ipomoea triloba]|uniref:uncharacterized protein LOC116020255 n=1 Tax=Ipomoea triloba TaxID=35885 RepID=UPI00125E1350|nr:uncharacterized protein LOC116020255 [Ipomoea triloba]
MSTFGPLVIAISLNCNRIEGSRTFGHIPVSFEQQRGEYGGPSRHRRNVEPMPIEEQIGDPNLDDAYDFWLRSDDSEEYVPSDDSGEYVHSHDSEEYVPHVQDNMSMRQMLHAQVEVQPDNASWYDDVEHSGQPSQYGSSLLQIGAVYESYKKLKKLVTQHNLAIYRQFTTLYKNPMYWKATCLHSQHCPWMIMATLVDNCGPQWVIKKFVDDHKCRVDYTRGGVDYILTSRVITDFILPKIEADPQYKIKYVQQDVNAKWGVNVDYKKAWYARVRALETLHGKWDESYNLLPKTLFAIQQTNPGTIVDIVGSPTNTPDEFHFKYAFWAFKAAIDGFKYCLPVLTIDGTHLYGKYKGNLLLAVSMNANREINGRKLLYAVVEHTTPNQYICF